MSARRRRARRQDPLATPEAVRRILERAAASLPTSISLKEKDLIRALRAASHCERTDWRMTRRGRQSRFDQETLRTLWRGLARELGRETRSHVSPRTFTEHYLRLLACPREAIDALADGSINLFEALQLARIKPTTGGLSSAAAAEMRRRVLAAHLTSRGSARQLYERVNALLGRGQGDPDAESRQVEAPDEAEEIDALAETYLADPGALFADQLRQVSAALAQLDADILSEAETTAILDLLDQLYLRAVRAARRTH